MILFGTFAPLHIRGQSPTRASWASVTYGAHPADEYMPYIVELRSGHMTFVAHEIWAKATHIVSDYHTHLSPATRLTLFQAQSALSA